MTDQRAHEVLLGMLTQWSAAQAMRLRTTDDKPIDDGYCLRFAQKIGVIPVWDGATWSLVVWGLSMETA